MMSTTTGSDVEAGFAKLQGEDFEYYMQTYSIILGRNSKKSTVDVDLSSLGGGMNISRHHARIFYDFQRRRFVLEVIGKNGCIVEGDLHLPGYPLVKLNSQDLLQIGDKKFYFLLPVKSILGGGGGGRGGGVVGRQVLERPIGRIGASGAVAMYNEEAGRGRGKSGYREEEVEEEDAGDEDEDDDVDEEEEDGVGGEEEDDYENDEDGDDTVGGSRSLKLPLVLPRQGDGRYGGGAMISGRGAGPSAQFEKKSEARSRADREADNHQLLQLEEKDVVSSVATVLSDLCGPGEWMPMAKLHNELVEKYSNLWHHGRVRRYLTSDDCSHAESKGKPWFGLLTLLRKYPEHFVINTRSKGRVTQEFVSLVSLVS
ncbi:hypothetical protein GIB67_040736 [Kingdonia uniflora]|uniref:FHA domain-containing protein n=1 Tax=Kingdonia uniflora TaxID=39325 RepID=A0A7J7KUG5_9MAGN|nr:hypothetical protein GIB67_040736 [Kingdonia uniflora]